MLLPLLTETDPAVTGEGSIDPLGLYAIADSLAVRLIPGIRERQVHPRFLTAIAVSLTVCSEFEEDTVAVDRISEPWQVFEWYMVEGLVRTISEDTQLRGLPGREKAAKAIQDGVPLSAKRYLKSPSIYGFHGVYRLLSHTLGVEIHGRLGEFGYDLLSTWAEEQGLKGFWGTADGPGADVRRQIRDAVSAGLEKGAIDRSWGWSGWQFFRNHLDHNNVGRKESQRITEALLNIKSGFRQPVLEFLISAEGRRIWKENDSERVFHKALVASRNSSLQELLTAILTYEEFARLMQDAFEDCLYIMSSTRSRTPLKDLQSSKRVQVAKDRVPSLFEKLVELLSPFQESIRFQKQFNDFANRMSSDQWTAHLLDHHVRVQRQKPPNGKAPWFERFDDGTYVIRPGYQRSERVDHGSEYVHAYRTGSLWSFALDLGLVT